jgi:maltokinase
LNARNASHNNSEECIEEDLLKNKIVRENWYPPNCREEPTIEYCTNVSGVNIVYGSACGKMFFTGYTLREVNGKIELLPGELNSSFYDQLLKNNVPGINSVILEPLDGIESVHTEPPGTSSQNFEAVIRTGKRIHVKSYRILNEDNLEPMILAYLKKHKSSFSPNLIGYIEFSGYYTHLITGSVNGIPIVSYFVRSALRTLETGNISIPEHSEYVGGLIGKLHNIMSGCEYDWCKPEIITEDDVSRWVFRVNWRLEQMENHPDPQVRDVSVRLMDNNEAISYLASQNLGNRKMRVHGDPHLYQFIITPNGRIMLVDYEGEPYRLPATQSEKEPPTRDLAVVYRSLHYIAVIAHSIQKGLSIKEASITLPSLMHEWISQVFNTVLEGYFAKAGSIITRQRLKEQIMFWSIERATYEFFYESIYNTGLEFIPLAWLDKIADEIAKVE